MCLKIWECPLGIFERENDDKPYWDDKPWGAGAFGFWILNKHFEPRDFENVKIGSIGVSNVLGRTWLVPMWVLWCPRGGFADAERYARCTLDRALDGCCRLHFYSFLRSFVLAAFAGENGEILEFPKVIILFLVILVGAPTKTWWVSTIFVYVYLSI